MPCLNEVKRAKKHNDMTAFGGVSQEVDVVADGFWGIAIVAYAIHKTY